MLSDDGAGSAIYKLTDLFFGEKATISAYGMFQCGCSRGKGGNPVRIISLQDAMKDPRSKGISPADTIHNGIDMMELRLVEHAVSIIVTLQVIDGGGLDIPECRRHMADIRILPFHFLVILKQSLFARKCWIFPLQTEEMYGIQFPEECDIHIWKQWLIRKGGFPLAPETCPVVKVEARRDPAFFRF